MTQASRRAFLRASDTATPEQAAAAATKVIADWETQRIRLALGREFAVASRVLLRRPRWMPNWLYRILMRSIIVEQGQVVDVARPKITR